MEKVLAHLQNRLWEIALILAFLLIYFLPWKFLTNDDEVMMWLVSGAYTGDPETYAVFIHPGLSWCFSLLYSAFPGILWYPLAWFVFQGAAGISIFGTIRQKFGKGLQAQIWNLILFALLIHFAFFLQFSLVAAFTSTAGILARIQAYTKSDFRILSFRKSDLFLLLGFLVRPEVPLLMLSGTLGLLLLLDGKASPWKSLGLPLGLLILSSGLTTLWMEAMGLGEFSRHNQLRSQVFDHPALQLDKEFWKESAPELYFFANGLQNFQDNTLTKEVLESWKSKLDERRGDLLSWEFLVSAFTSFFYKQYFLLAILSVMVSFGFLVDFRRSLPLFLLLIGGLMGLSFYFLLKIQVISLVLLTYLILLFQRKTQITVKSPRVYQMMAGILMTLIGVHFYAFFQSKKNLQEGFQVENTINSYAGKERIYLIGTSKYYPNLIWDKPLKFKILGWPSLLERYQQQEDSTSYVFLVEKFTFQSNQGYFEKAKVEESLTEDFVWIQEK